MPKINVGKGESIDKALKKFKRKMRREGLIDELRKREFYEKPSDRKRKDKARAVKKERRRRREEDNW